MLAIIKDFIIKMCCYFFGHKLLGRPIIAYSIDIECMYVTISTYKVSKCARCGRIFRERIDSYDKYGWYSQYFADEEELTLRKRGIISITEAYQEIEKED